jgi:hypothetical protein
MGRTFTVATDETLITLIATARHRLVVIAPALTVRVAEALVARFRELGQLDVRVVLDADAEVYRLGFGEEAALATIREAAERNQLDLRQQSGVRIGVVIADDDTMIFSPVSKNIEAGSTFAEKPNAILLSGVSASVLALAAGISDDPDNARATISPEVGSEALRQETVAKMQEDLKRNPPAQFDITRRLNVFSSRVVYIEFEMKNSKLSAKKVKLPEEFGTVSNKSLRDQISATIKAPFADVVKVTVKVGEGQAARQLKIDEKWLQQERKRIVDHYTFQINNFGRVILREDRAGFETAVTNFRETVEQYRAAVREKLLLKRATFITQFVSEFLPRWKKSPPEHLIRWGNTSLESLKAELAASAEKVFEQMLDFEPPEVHLVEKSVSPKNVADPKFLEPLRTNMERRRVPQHIITTLFDSGDAAPESGRLL